MKKYINWDEEFAKEVEKLPTDLRSSMMSLLLETDISVVTDVARRINKELLNIKGEK